MVNFMLCVPDHNFFFFFGCAAWLVGFQFPNQGLNPSQSSESPESQPLGHQGTPQTKSPNSRATALSVLGCQIQSLLYSFYTFLNHNMLALERSLITTGNLEPRDDTTMLKMAYQIRTGSLVCILSPDQFLPPRLPFSLQ